MNQTMKEIRDEYADLLSGIQEKWKSFPEHITGPYQKDYDLLVDKIKTLIRLTTDVAKLHGNGDTYEQ